MKKVLIVSDRKPGHFNQSVALCHLLDLPYEVLEVNYPHRIRKALSYPADRLRFYHSALFETGSHPSPEDFELAVATGSTTYYPAKLFARRLKIPVVAILHPKGYRLDFDHIFIPFYDHPPRRKNITPLPLNLCSATPAFFRRKTEEFKQRHRQQAPAAALIIGGPNAVSTIDPVSFRTQVQQIFSLTEGMERWVTTSRRTPPEIEQILEQFDFDYRLIHSRDPYNPVPAFIQNSERLFVTSDSASMISECASFGRAKVEVLMTKQLRVPNKFIELIDGLEARGAVHRFDGSLGDAGRKIDLGPIVKKALASLIKDRRP